MVARRNRSKFIPILSLVARRVQTWLIPIQYEITIFLHRGINSSDPIYRRLHNLSERPSNLRLHHVKHLMIFTVDRKDFLSECYNLQELAFWSFVAPQTLSDLTTALRSPLRTSPFGLLRLSAVLSDFFPRGKIDFHHEVFKDLTHLQCLDRVLAPGQQEWQEGNNLTYLRNLRCLAFENYQDRTPYSHDFLIKCLEECQNLDLMIVGSSDGPAPESLTRVLRVNGQLEEVPEDRVVLTPYERIDMVVEWYIGAEGGDAFWSKAERIVKRRRWKREVEANAWDPISEVGLDMNLGDWLSLAER